MSFKKINIILSLFVFIFFYLVPTGQIKNLANAATSYTTDSSTWYLRSTTASAAFGTTGPTTEQSTATDLVSSSPTSKSTALAMTTDPGTSQTSVAGTETTASAGQIWYRTFLSPKLAAQTINSGTTFRFEGALQENSTSANLTFRIHVYQ